MAENENQTQMSELEKATAGWNQVADTWSNWGSNSNLEGKTNTDPNTSGYNYNILRGSTPANYTGSYSTPGGSLVTISGSNSGGTSTDYYSDLIRNGSSGGGGSSGGSVSVANSGYQGELMAKPELQAPDAYKAPEYKPPEYDESEERKIRNEYMAPGEASLRKATSEAIISSKSIDNPNARAMFINKALEGVGTAMGDISTSASNQAREEGWARYSDSLTKYNTTWEIANTEQLSAWNTQWQTALLEYQNEFSLFSKMPLESQVEAWNNPGTTPTSGSSGGGSVTRYGMTYKPGF